MSLTAPPEFAAAITEMMADPAFAQPATYTPPAGLPVATRADVQRTTRVAADGLSIERVLLAYLPAADVPAPQVGASLVVDQSGVDIPYRVEGVAEDDGAVVTVVVRPL